MINQQLLQILQNQYTITDWISGVSFAMVFVLLAWIINSVKNSSGYKRHDSSGADCGANIADCGANIADCGATSFIDG